MKKEVRLAPSATEKQQVERLRQLLRFAQGDLAVEQFQALVGYVLPQALTAIPEHNRMTDARFDELRVWLRKGFEQIAGGDEFVISEPFCVAVTRDRFEYRSDDPMVRYRHAIVNILNAGYWRVARCERAERCGKLFVSVNGSLFCSQRCADAHRIWRRRHRIAETPVIDLKPMTPAQARKRRAQIVAEPPRRWTDPD
jgi:hypothetical protein